VGGSKTWFKELLGTIQNVKSLKNDIECLDWMCVLSVKYIFPSKKRGQPVSIMFNLEHLSHVHCHSYRWLVIVTEVIHKYRHVITQSI
jgi:hypothetical protein